MFQAALKRPQNVALADTLVSAQCWTKSAVAVSRQPPDGAFLFLQEGRNLE